MTQPLYPSGHRIPTLFKQWPGHGRVRGAAMPHSIAKNGIEVNDGRFAAHPNGFCVSLHGFCLFQAGM
ncbi:unnamed protein product [Dicrocoelium dendriticum]|nr:unnamed protein product [Dicrocoelium dendriticum]